MIRLVLFLAKSPEIAEEMKTLYNFPLQTTNFTFKLHGFENRVSILNILRLIQRAAI